MVIRRRGEDEDLVDDVRLVEDEYVNIWLLSSSGMPSQPVSSVPISESSQGPIESGLT